MHKNGKWARQIVALQDDEGKWGNFHSMSQFSAAPITTEQALRRLERLGFGIEDECIQKAVAYMDDCLAGKKCIPDHREKIHDWDVFTALILSTWIRRFTRDNARANEVAGKWAQVVTQTFSGGVYDQERYSESYRDVIMPSGGRLIGFLNFYPISITAGLLDKKTCGAATDFILQSACGIYYIYDRKLAELPADFCSRDASRYLAAIELLAEHTFARHKLGFVSNWLESCRNGRGRWDMGKSVCDKIYFPLSDDWRTCVRREADCTERISKLISAISSPDR